MLVLTGYVQHDRMCCVNKGAELVRDFLQRPDFSLARLILERAHVAVVPCINRIGNMANARTAPMRGPGACTISHVAT